MVGKPSEGLENDEKVCVVSLGVDGGFAGG